MQQQHQLNILLNQIALCSTQNNKRLSFSIYLFKFVIMQWMWAINDTKMFFTTHNSCVRLIVSFTNQITTRKSESFCTYYNFSRINNRWFVYTETNHPFTCINLMCTHSKASIFFYLSLSFVAPPPLFLPVSVCIILVNESNNAIN